MKYQQKNAIYVVHRVGFTAAIIIFTATGILAIGAIGAGVLFDLVGF